MKIIYVITKANWGGAQRYVYDLATAAKTEGFDVAVAYGEPGLLATRLEEAGIRTIKIAALGRDVGALRDVRTFFALLRLLRSERPDIVHLNSSKAGALGALSARLAHVPHVIFTAHGWAFNESRPWWQRMLIYKIAWLTVLLAHTTICVSDAIRRDTRRMPFVRGKLLVIHNGVAEPVYKTHEDARTQLWPGHQDGYWVGMLSELHATKRVEDAVRAAGLVRATCPEVRLVVLGEGHERPRLESLIKAEALESIVRLAGFVPEGASYLKAFDLFLHTSESEALGYAVIEAALAGVPVVATRVGGIPEIISDTETGVLIAPRAPHIAAEAMSSIMSDPASGEHMGKRLEEEVRKRFNKERMVQETLALYKDER